MSNNVSVKTNFTAGQVSPLIYGRGDLGIFENGARTLENVIIHPTAGCGVLTRFPAPPVFCRLNSIPNKPICCVF